MKISTPKGMESAADFGAWVAKTCAEMPHLTIAQVAEFAADARDVEWAKSVLEVHENAKAQMRKMAAEFEEAALLAIREALKVKP